MSFGFSPSDIVSLITLTAKAYSAWQSSLGEYREIAASLNDLRLLLRRLDTCLSPRGQLTSLPDDVQRARAAADREDLDTLVHNCEDVVKELYGIVKKYRSLERSKRDHWKRLRFGSKDLDTLRLKLSDHVSKVSLFLLAVQTEGMSRLESLVVGLPGSIVQNLPHAIGDLIDARIQARASVKGSVMTALEDDNRDTWKQFCRELRRNGVRSSHLDRHGNQSEAALHVTCHTGVRRLRVQRQ